MALSKDQEHAAVILLSVGAGRISLAGGAALIVHGLVDRPTHDLDAFSQHDADVPQIAASVAAAFTAAGYAIKDVSEIGELRTFMVSRQKRQLGRPARAVKVQLGRDFQLLDSVPSRVGQTLDPLELAANKILTVYDRPRARDADDIARLVPRFGLRRMLDIADRKQVEPLDRRQLADAFQLLRRIADSEFPYPENAPAVKQYMGRIAEAAGSGTPLLMGERPYASPPQAKGKNSHATGKKPETPRTSRPVPPVPAKVGGLCGARTTRGGVCRNPAGSCRHHRKRSGR